MKDSHARVRSLFPIFTQIEETVNELNALLETADAHSLSIRFTQKNKQIPTPTGETVDGPPEPHLYMTTISFNTPKEK
jgi:hypothetical protein